VDDLETILPAFQLLRERAEELIDELGCDVTDIVATEGAPEPLRAIDLAYDRLSAAYNDCGASAEWQSSDGEYLLRRLWELRAALAAKYERDSDDTSE